ncbi:12232_t:CDS:1 [Dentiscutata erythropus]|uniref:12232_t:CDS:1 n=1 Tax=Dentiscutata erythropus TaxID=1348616 RepID=A0A9N9FXM2_9GLOM|nr:12232_t:CDS:1 [Dentiscutata erythropus]
MSSLEVVKPTESNFVLPTILENEEIYSEPGTFEKRSVQEPSISGNTIIAEKNNTSPLLNVPNRLGTRPNTPDTDITAVDSINGASESSLAHSHVSRPTTPSSDKKSKRNNSLSPSSSQPSINGRSRTPDPGKKTVRSIRNKASSSSLSSRAPSRSRSNTPDPDRSNSQIRRKPSQQLSPIDGEYEMKPFKEPLTSSNFIHIGVSGEINLPTAYVRETTIGVFHIFNPTDNIISWGFSQVDRPMFRRLGTATNAAQKVDDDIFVLTKLGGLLRPKNAERVDVKFRPMGVGTYMQTFVLEDTSEGGTGGVDAVSMKFQGVATENTFSSLLQKHRAPKKEVKFEVDETEIRIPATRVGKQRSMGIKITNVAKEPIRLSCKCETTTGPGGKFVLSLPMNSVVVKAEGFSIIPVRFQPRAVGEVKGVVTIHAMNNAEVKVDVVAKGILDPTQTT